MALMDEKKKKRKFSYKRTMPYFFMNYINHDHDNNNDSSDSGDMGGGDMGEIKKYIKEYVNHLLLETSRVDTEEMFHSLNNGDYMLIKTLDNEDFKLFPGDYFKSNNDYIKIEISNKEQTDDTAKKRYRDIYYNLIKSIEKIKPKTKKEVKPTKTIEKQ